MLWLGKIFFISRDFSFAWRLMAVISIGIGIVFRTWQYLSNPSIWVDEAALARNIWDWQPWQLLGPLDYGQLAPRGFMVGTKLIAMVFGYSEYALRIIPYFASLASLVLFFILARLILRSVGALVAMLMFSLAFPLIFFSANLKPYASDVALALTVLLSTLWIRSHVLKRNDAVILALLSLPLLFFSQALVFTLAVCGLALCIDTFARSPEDRWYRVFVITIWGFGVITTLAYNSLVMTDADTTYVYRFWLSSFMPSENTLPWAWGNFQKVFGGMPQTNSFDGALHYPVPILFACLAVIGGMALWIDDPFTGMLISGPICLVLAASGFHLFPFGTRLSLFLIPMLLIMVIAGIEKVGWTARHFGFASYISVLLLPFICITIIQERLPRKPEHIRPVMQYIQDNWKDEDVLWVYYGAGQAFQYYRNIIPIKGTVYMGECNRAEPRAYLHQLDIVKGDARTWILFAHGSGRFRFNERGLITDYLNTIGTQLDHFHAPMQDVSTDRAEVFLYDLSNLKKLETSSPDQFEIENPYPSVLWSCYSTMSPFTPNKQIMDDLMHP